MPDRLPDFERDLLWTASLGGPGVGGLVIAGDVVIASGRDITDGSDQFDAFDVKTGSRVWSYTYSAPAALDYGNSPRATPAFASGVLVTQGATGRLTGRDLATGVALWSLDLSKLVGKEVPTWGFSGSPLIIGDRVYVQAGKSSSLIVIDLFSGATVASYPGPSTVYSSLVPIQYAGRSAVAGVDAERYFIRAIRDGAVLWSHQPELSGDFGVPTPVVVPGGLVFVGENNGVQLFLLTQDGLEATPAAINDSLAPDSHTPVSIGKKLFIASAGLHCLSIDKGLRADWSLAESLVTEYASIIASQERALVTTENGKLLLFDTSGGELIDKAQFQARNVKVLSHPAVTMEGLLIRLDNELRCYRFGKF